MIWGKIVRYQRELLIRVAGLLCVIVHNSHLRCCSFIFNGCISQWPALGNGNDIVQRECWSLPGQMRWQVIELHFWKPQRLSDSRLQHKPLCGMYACNDSARAIMQMFVALNSFCLFWCFFPPLWDFVSQSIFSRWPAKLGQLRKGLFIWLYNLLILVTISNQCL